MNNKPYIYCIVNTINGKMYIGKHCGKNPEYMGSGVVLHQAYEKYSEEAFSKIIIEYCDLDKLNEREIYWISFYNTFRGRGYNMSAGGDGCTGFKHSPESIKKMKIVQSGKIISLETREKLRNYNLGRHPSEKTKQLISEKLKGVKKKPFTKEHIKKLSLAKKGKKKDPFSESHKKNIGLTKRKSVIMYDINWNEIMRFTHMSAASDYIKGCLSEISKSCNDGKTTVKGYRFRFENCTIDK